MPRHATLELPRELLTHDRKQRQAIAVPYLRRALEVARAGGQVFDTFADGSANGWHARMEFERHIPGSLSRWDSASGRLPIERIAALTKALTYCGEEVQVARGVKLSNRLHGGGWTVTR